MIAGEFVVGWSVGVIGGALASWWFWREWARQRICRDPSVHELTDADRDVVAREFEQHTTAVQRQVSEYADVLAGPDEVLRERLGRFERGAMMGILILAAFVLVFSAAAIDEFVGFGAIGQNVRDRRIARRQAARRRRLVERVRMADVRLAAEQQRAKRQMNDAVNQSWRNLAS